MENVKKKNIFSRIISFISERINQIDIPDGVENLTKAEREEVENANKVQAEVHEQKGFVQRADVNEKTAQVTAKRKSQSSAKNKGNTEMIHENA